MRRDTEKLHLPEDQDILSELEKVREPTAGIGESARMHKLAALQIEAVLRNRKTTEELNKSTARYSRALIAFAFAQLTLGLFQFIFDTSTSTHAWIGAVYVVAAGILIVYIFHLLFPEKGKKD